MQNDFAKDDVKKGQIFYDHIKHTIMASRVVSENYLGLLSNCRKLLLISRHNLMRLRNEEVDSLGWRNMAPEQRKQGKDITSIIFLTFSLATIVLVIGYPRVSPEPEWMHQSFSQDEFKCNIWFHLILYLMVACLIQFYLSAKSTDKIGLRKKPYFYKYIDEALISSQKETFFRGNQYKLRRLMRMIIDLIKAFKSEPKKKILFVLLKFPIYRFYLLAFIFWIYINLMAHYFLINNGHFSKTKQTFLEIYYCFHTFNIECHPTEQYYWTKAIYATSTLFILTLCYQIKLGIPVWKSLITNFDAIEKIQNIIMNAAPFVKEISVLLKFASTKTSITMFEWMTISDIYYVMKTTKFNQKQQDQSKFVAAAGYFLKIIFVIGIIIVTILTVVGPLLPFNSWGVENKVFKIESSRVEIGISTNKGVYLGNIFSSSMMLSSDERDSKDKKWSFIEKSKIYKDISPNRIRIVKMSSFSQTYHDLGQTDQISQEVNLANDLDGGKIKITVSFDTEKGKFIIDYDVTIKGTHVAEIKNIIETDCSSVRLNREMFLQGIPMVYRLNTINYPTLEIIEENDLKKDTVKKWSLGVECSDFNQTYFFISNEKEEYLEFLVITETRPEVTDLIHTYFKVDIKIIFLYIVILKYIGISVVRKFTFGRTTEIWYKDIPRPEMMLILIDAVEMAQFQGDLLKEDILYNYIVQLLRNPDDLKNMTGDMLKHRLNLHMESCKKNILNQRAKNIEFIGAI